MFRQQRLSAPRRAFTRRQFLTPCDLEAVRGSVVIDTDARYEVSEDRSVLEQMTRAAAGKQYVIVLRMTVDYKVRIGGEDNLVEL